MKRVVVLCECENAAAALRDRDRRRSSRVYHRDLQRAAIKPLPVVVISQGRSDGQYLVQIRLGRHWRLVCELVKVDRHRVSLAIRLVVERVACRYAVDLGSFVFVTFHHHLEGTIGRLFGRYPR